MRCWGETITNQSPYSSLHQCRITKCFFLRGHRCCSVDKSLLWKSTNRSLSPRAHIKVGRETWTSFSKLSSDLHVHAIHVHPLILYTTVIIIIIICTIIIHFKYLFSKYRIISMPQRLNETQSNKISILFYSCIFFIWIYFLLTYSSATIEFIFYLFSDIGYFDSVIGLRILAPLP